MKQCLSLVLVLAGFSALVADTIKVVNVSGRTVWVAVLHLTPKKNQDDLRSIVPTVLKNWQSTVMLTEIPAESYALIKRPARASLFAKSTDRFVLASDDLAAFKNTLKGAVWSESRENREMDELQPLRSQNVALMSDGRRTTFATTTAALAQTAQLYVGSTVSEVYVTVDATCQLKCIDAAKLKRIGREQRLGTGE